MKKVVIIALAGASLLSGATAQAQHFTVAEPLAVEEGGVRYRPWSGQPSEEFKREGPRQNERRYDDSEVLFAGDVAHGGYGALETKLSGALDAPASLLGVRGGWIIDHRLVVGIAGYGLATRHDVPTATRVQGAPSILGFGYGGLRGDCLLMPHRLFHFSVGALVGAGGLTAISRDELPGYDEGEVEYEHRTAHADALFVLEPELGMELNVVRFMRLYLALSYRYVTAVDAPGLSSRKLSAPAGALALKFGHF